MKNKKGKLKWIMIIVFLILISVTIIPTTSYTAEIKVKKIYKTTDNTTDETAILDWKGRSIVIDLTEFRDEPKKTSTFRTNRKSKQSKWQILATIIAVTIIAIVILCIVIALIKLCNINSKEKGFLRLTSVLSILSAIIAFIWAGFHGKYIAETLGLVFVWFIAIWIAYVIARWIIPPIIKWIIKGFGEDEIKKFFTNTGKLRIFVYICVGILSIILSIYFFSSIITKSAIIKKHHTRRDVRLPKSLEKRREALIKRQKTFYKRRKATRK